MEPGSPSERATSATGAIFMIDHFAVLPGGIAFSVRKRAQLSAQPKSHGDSRNKYRCALGHDIGRFG